MVDNSDESYIVYLSGWMIDHSTVLIWWEYGDRDGKMKAVNCLIDLAFNTTITNRLVLITAEML